MNSDSRHTLSALRDLFCHTPYCFNDEMWFRQLNIVTAIMRDLMFSLRQLPLNLRELSCQRPMPLRELDGIGRFWASGS